MRFIWLALLFTGCASTLPPFQKQAGDQPGYTVVKAISPQGFILKVDLKGHADAKYATLYGNRAVAEECKSHGFDFFDVGVVDFETFEGYCYKSPDHPALAVEFTDRGLDARPQHFVVGNLMEKTNTKLQKGDEITSIDGAPPLSVATFKAMIFRAASAGHKSVDLKILRDKSELEIKEPIALLKNSSMGSSQLDLFRSRVK